jgi:TatD DNase family protein
MQYADAHSHLCLPVFDGRRDEAIARAVDQGITRFVQGGYSPQDWDRQLELARAHPGKFTTAFGLHPWWVAEVTDAQVDAGLAALEKRVSESEALGELGLDHGRRCGPETHARQLKAFKAQAVLAWEYRRPLVLHVVKAHAEALAVLKEVGVPLQGGIVHAFGGTPAQAEAYVSLGLAISVGKSVGVAEGREGLKKAVARVELRDLCLESDEDEPATIWTTAEHVARLRGEAGGAEAIMAASTRNVERIFGIVGGAVGGVKT